jgi:hypothetical protein
MRRITTGLVLTLAAMRALVACPACSVASSSRICTATANRVATMPIPRATCATVPAHLDRSACAAGAWGA